MVSDEGIVTVAPAERQVDHLQNALSFLEKHICFFKLFLFYKVISDVCELWEKIWNFVLIHFNFFVIKLVKRVIFIFVKRLSIHFEITFI